MDILTLGTAKAYTDDKAGDFLDDIVYSHPRGDSEMNGVGTYFTSPLIGFNELMTHTIMVNKVELPAYSNSDYGTFEWRVYVNNTRNVFDLSTTEPKAAGHLTFAQTNHTLGGKQYIDLGCTVTATVDKYFIIILSATMGDVVIPRWRVQSSTSPSRHGFYLKSTKTWDGTLSFSSDDYLQPAFRLYYLPYNLPHKPLFSLPSKIYSIVGQEVNIYFDNLIAGKAERYDWDVSVGSIGTQQNERWTAIPIADNIGSHVMLIRAYEENEEVAANTGTTTLVVTDATVGTGVSKTCLFIGDSLIAANAYTSNLLTLFGENEPMDITLIGTQGISPNLHEGYGGKTIDWFYTHADSPFVFDGVFNFSQYMTTNSFASVDVVTIMLGINDVFSLNTDGAVALLITEAFAQLESIITSIKVFNVNVKIGIVLTVPPSIDQDAFGSNYGEGQTKWRYKRNNMLFVRNLIRQFDNRSNIYCVPVNLNLDTKHNMSVDSTTPWNSRTSATTIRQNNGVHPASEGYYQIADAFYYWLKSLA